MQKSPENSLPYFRLKFQVGEKCNTTPYSSGIQESRHAMCAPIPS